jgi:cell division protein FtsQ
MSEQRKISTRKIIQALVTLLLLAACVLVMVRATTMQKAEHLKGVHINIQNEAYCQFISKEAIEHTLFDNRHIAIPKTLIASVDLKKMERILATNPWVESAQVFIDNQRYLNINVVQRIPQLRVFDRNGNSYYIDSAKHCLPIADNYTHYEILFVNVPVINEDSIGWALKNKMLAIAKKIKADTFWQAQTAEIIVQDLNNYQIIPVLGNQKILLGDTNNLKSKLENVFAFYKNIENKIGWDKYEVIDARFDNQIVAAPSLPWKAPIDRAITNMNWVKTIVDNSPKDQADGPMSSINPINTIDTSKKSKP